MNHFFAFFLIRAPLEKSLLDFMKKRMKKFLFYLLQTRTQTRSRSSHRRQRKPSEQSRRKKENAPTREGEKERERERGSHATRRHFLPKFGDGDAAAGLRGDEFVLHVPNLLGGVDGQSREAQRHHRGTLLADNGPAQTHD